MNGAVVPRADPTACGRTFSRKPALVERKHGHVSSEGADQECSCTNREISARRTVKVGELVFGCVEGAWKRVEYCQDCVEQEDEGVWNSHLQLQVPRDGGDSGGKGCPQHQVRQTNYIDRDCHSKHCSRRHVKVPTFNISLFFPIFALHICFRPAICAYLLHFSTNSTGSAAKETMVRRDTNENLGSQSLVWSNSRHQLMLRRRWWRDERERLDIKHSLHLNNLQGRFQLRGYRIEYVVHTDSLGGRPSST